MDNDSRVSWRNPIHWPPSKWRWTPAHQFAADAALVALGAAFVVIAASALAALFILPIQALAALIREQHETARNYLLALGALLGVPFLIWRTLIAARQASISRESLYTQLFASGVERLGAEKTVKIVEETHRYKKVGDDWARDGDGNPIPALRPDGKQIVEYKTHEKTVLNIENRLGAVYALERVSIDSKRDNAAITRTLASYIKNNIAAISPNGDGDILRRTDVQAAIAVLSRIHSPVLGDPALDITGIDLKNFEINSMNLNAWNISNSKSNDFSSIKSTFRNCQISECDWHTPQFHLSTIIDCESSDSKFSSSVFNASTIKDSIFERADLANSKFSNTAFTNCLFIGCDFSHSEFEDCYFSNVEIIKSDIQRARFNNGELSNVKFDRTNMLLADISTVNCQNLIIENSHITALKHNLNIVINREINLEMSDEWFDDVMKEVKYAEIAFMRLEYAWNDWLRSRG